MLLGTRRRTAALAVVACCLAVLAMGRYTPPSRWLLTHPPLALFRYPAKYFTGFALCAALLAGFGFDRLGALARRTTPSTRRATLAGVGIAVLFLCCLPVLQRPVFRSGLQVGFTWLAGTFAVLAVAFFAIPRGRRRGARVRLAFGVVLALELVAYVARFPPSAG